MRNVLLLLDEVPTSTAQEGVVDDWFFRVQNSLNTDRKSWLSVTARIGQLSDEHAWSLLAWIEVAANAIVRTRSRDYLVIAAFAMALVLQSALDRRDCAIVASLLRRAATLAGLDFTANVTEGCDRAGAIGQQARGLLVHASANLPSTHVETGANEAFKFMRTQPGFDVGDLQRWLGGDIS